MITMRDALRALPLVAAFLLGVVVPTVGLGAAAATVGVLAGVVHLLAGPRRPAPPWSAHLVGDEVCREHFERLQADTGEETARLIGSALAIYRYVVDVDRGGGSIVSIENLRAVRSMPESIRSFELIDGGRFDDG